jgi:hypothetical protein
MDPIKAAKNQTLFREVNERIKNFDYANPQVKFICECARPECRETVAMSLDDYEEIRRIPTHFFVVGHKGHVFLDVERIFETHSDYWVVEKFGRSGVEAIRLDPRKRVAEAGL